MVDKGLSTNRSTSARVVATRRLFGYVLFGFFGFALAVQPLLGVAIWRFDKVHAQNQTAEPEDQSISPEDFGEGNPVDSLAELEPLFYSRSALSLSAQDINAIRDNRVDVRVTDYLIYLVTPVEQGGAGLAHVKAQRILKNYDTSGTGRLDRETLAAIEESNSVVSAHNDGQAVDISEIGSITCKMVERRHLGGSTTRWQKPKPIKVAWQSRDGIRRNPTPKGVSFFETSSNMSAQSILMMLNESGELDELSDYVRGLSIEEIFQYVGANVLLKNYGTGEILVDPRSGEFANVLGALLLQKAIPNLPTGLPIADPNQDVRAAIARAHLEELLNLPPGSLRGSGWREILKSTGQRTLENAWGLPTLTLEKQPLSKVLDNKSVQAALKEFSDGDETFGVMAGTMALIQAKNELGYVYAGVNLLADALRLSSADRAKLADAARRSTNPDISIETVGTDQNVEVDVLRAIVDSTNTQDRLKQFGQKYLSEVLYKVVPNSLLGLTRDVLNDLASSGSQVAYGELTKLMGLRKMASDSSIKPEDAGRLQSGNNSQYVSAVAGVLNENFDLSGASQLTGADINGLLKEENTTALAKLGGNQADKAIGWNEGTGYQVVTKQKTFNQGLQEVFGNSLAEVIGLPKEAEISLSGDLYRNYGNSFVEARLGLDVSGSGGSINISTDHLLESFGLPAFRLGEERDISDLRADSAYWGKKEVVDALEFSDIRLGVPIGTSESYLMGKIDNKALAKAVAKENLSRVTKSHMMNYLDLDDSYGLSSDDFSLLFDTLSDWDNTSFEDQQKVINIGKRLIGRSLDQRSTFEKDSIVAIAQGKNSEAVVGVLINQGVRQLAGAFGVNIASFEPRDLGIMTRLLTAAYNGDFTGIAGAYGFTAEGLATKWIADATNIPVTEDVQAFIRGDLRAGLEYWSAAQMVEFTEKYLPEGATLAYEEIRNSIRFDNLDLITARATELAKESGGSASAYLDQARKELMQEARDGAKYKISDAFLHQAEIPIPLNFSKIMFSGTDRERAEVLTQATFAYLDQELAKISGVYVPGTLEKIYNGDLSSIETDQLITNITGNSGVTIGPFSSGFVVNFYSFIKAADRNSFYTNSRYDQMWSSMENWMGNSLGVAGLPAGFAKTVYFAADNNWSFNTTLKDAQGNVVVNSINGLGRELLASRITQWADSTLNLPAGSAYQIYRAASAVSSASRILAQAWANAPVVGGVTTKTAEVASAQEALSGAQAELTAIAINVALNACAACQQFFASVDRILAAPPGFTNTLVAGAISMALGLGPAGLIAAAAIYLFGVYRVDYLCPLPPPDRFAYVQFDNEYDRTEPSSNDYYADPKKPIKDNPAVGENPFDWDNGVPFRNGNNPELWMAWSRYFTGKLLDATMTYGATKSGAGKPLQIITYRQANVEYFASRSKDTFGEKEKNNNLVGLGFTQKSTKTTDWVHASFGGLF